MIFPVAGGKKICDGDNLVLLPFARLMSFDGAIGKKTDSCSNHHHLCYLFEPFKCPLTGPVTVQGNKETEQHKKNTTPHTHK